MRTIVQLGLIVASLLGTAGVVRAVDAKPAKKADTVEKKAAKPAVAAKEVAAEEKPVRLPRLIGEVAEKKQMEALIAVHAKYIERLRKIRRDLRELTAERDGELEKLLSDAQREKLAKLRAADRAAKKAEDMDEE